MLKGKTAVVTGGSRGIGRAIAEKFAQNGADVAVIYSGNQDAAESVCADAATLGAKAIAYRCDAENFGQVQDVSARIVSDFGRIDILINNAGITRDGLLLRMSEEDFDRVLGVNLKGAFNFTRHLARFLMRSPAGRIVNISSVTGLVGNAGQANYAASKAALIGLTKTVARELAARNVTCNAIAPGFIDTDMTGALSAEAAERLKARIPLGRAGGADEVAELALFLCSDRAAYITGEVVRIDGGMAM